MIKAKEPTVGERFKILRENAGYSLERLAKAMDYAGASSLQEYDSPHRTEFISVKLAKKLVGVLAGKGNPPISTESIYRLAGISPAGSERPPTARRMPVTIDQVGLTQAIALARKILTAGGVEPTDETLADAIMDVYEHTIRSGAARQPSEPKEPE